MPDSLRVPRATQPKPLILIATRETWQRRELASALADAGFDFSTAYDERETLVKVHAESPQAIVMDVGVAPPGYALCRRLRTLTVATPIVLTAPGEITPAQQNDAFRAGAWAMLGTPLDADALRLRLSVYIEPKLELERVSAECLVDRASGLYNPSGLTRRADELSALATRHGLSLACAVFRPTAQLLDDAAGDRIAVAFKRAGRASDALGRTAPEEFTVFAPATNGTAFRLVRRLTDNVERALGSARERHKRVGMRSGYSTAPAAHRISPPMLLTWARQALEMSA